MIHEPFILSERLNSALHDLARALDRHAVQQKTIDAILAELGDLPPEMHNRVAREVALTAQLYHRHPPSRIRRWFGALIDPFPRRRGLELVFLFHFDGHVRQAALERIRGGLRSPFWFAAVAYRLNDWVAQVRQAALDCAERTFPLTDPAIITRAAIVLLAKRHAWRRWGPEARALDKALARSDVIDALAQMIAKSPTGPMATLLRAALRQPHMDRHLSMLATKAIQPSVRAVAAQTLIEGRIRWVVGVEKKWIDKSLGQYRQGPAFAERAIECALPLEDIVRAAALDRTGAVRRIAASGLIRHRDTLANLEQVASMLADDTSAAVRWRIAYLGRRQAGQ